MNIAVEQWRPVLGFEGRYEVSSHGFIRNISGRYLRAHPRARGLPYLTVLLHGVDGAASRKTVHSLVLEAFVSPRPVGAVARHLDGDPLNNRESNLKWGTVAENVADRKLHGTENVGERNPRAKLTRAQATEIKSSTARTVDLAAAYGISSPQVSAIRAGRSWA